MKLLIVFSIFFICGFCDFTPKRYSIDLDGEPRKRWKEVIEDHKEFLPEVVRESRKYIPKFAQPFVFWFAKLLIHFFPHDYQEELRGISEYSNLPLGEVVGMNILYDISAFDRHHIFGLGCTSIVAEDSKGRIYHGRNLDYEMPELLRNITVIVDFKRKDKIIYTGTTFALYNGLLTGQRPNTFSVTLNARYAGGYIDNILMELYTHFKNPVSFVIRQVLEEEEYYFWAVERLSSTPLICPAYIVVAGTKSGEGAIISRNRMKAADVQTLNVSKGRWFLVETNFDHWNKQGDMRKKVATHSLRKMGQIMLNADSLYRKVLNRPMVYNNLTIYSSVMQPAVPEVIYTHTKVRTPNKNDE